MAIYKLNHIAYYDCKVVFIVQCKEVVKRLVCDGNRFFEKVGDEYGNEYLAICENNQIIIGFICA